MSDILEAGNHGGNHGINGTGDIDTGGGALIGVPSITYDGAAVTFPDGIDMEESELRNARLKGVVDFEMTGDNPMVLNGSGIDTMGGNISAGDIFAQNIEKDGAQVATENFVETYFIPKHVPIVADFDAAFTSLPASKWGVFEDALGNIAICIKNAAGSNFMQSISSSS